MAEIRAEMVANVWKVVAAEGDHVDDGDTLVILESMKMEIPVLAESHGVVTTMHVAEGDVVQEGDLIAVIGLRPRATGTAGPTLAVRLTVTPTGREPVRRNGSADRPA